MKTLITSILVEGARKVLDTAMPALPVRLKKEGGLVLLSPKLVEMAAKRAVASMKEKEIELVEMTLHDTHYGFLLAGPQKARILIRIVPEWLSVDGDTVKVGLSFFGGRKAGMEFQHDSAPMAFSIRLIDNLFGVAKKRIDQMEGVEMHEDAMTITRNLTDSGLIAAIRDRIVGNRCFHLPLSLDENWLALHLGTLLKENTHSIILEPLLRWFSLDDDSLRNQGKR
ncbi:MAG: hypothetical protein HQL78_06640 [Magnetococcales bacterium]|nr:hypothetical protein [Magnetococcales bacterium]MBF0419829.1 hypothetical protein [Magnetococcales bacterium]